MKKKVKRKYTGKPYLYDMPIEIRNRLRHIQKTEGVPMQFQINRALMAQLNIQ